MNKAVYEFVRGVENHEINDGDYKYTAEWKTGVLCYYIRLYYKESLVALYDEHTGRGYVRTVSWHDDGVQSQIIDGFRKEGLKASSTRVLGNFPTEYYVFTQQ